MPSAVTAQIGPISHEPEFIGRVLGAEDIHANKTWSSIDKVRPEKESFLNRGSHVVGHDKSAENAYRLIVQRSYFCLGSDTWCKCIPSEEIEGDCCGGDRAESTSGHVERLRLVPVLIVKT